MNWSLVNMAMFVPAMITLGIILLLHIGGAFKRGTPGRVACYVNISLHLLLIALLAFSNVSLELLTLCLMTSVAFYSAVSYIAYRHSKDEDEREREEDEV